MIKSITVDNLKGLVKTLYLSRPDKSGFAIADVQGLGPVKSNVSMSSFANLDGAKFNSAIAGTRNIVFTLYFLDKPTIEKVRMESYQLFPLKGEVELIIETSNRKVKTNGIVESNEPSIFSNRENTKVSIICPDSYFHSIEPVSLPFFGSEPMFEFPFENLLMRSPHLIMSNKINKDQRTIEYDGDGEAGVTIIINCHGPVEDLLIYNIETQEAFRINAEKVRLFTGSKLKDMDIVTICTIPGKKSITLTREGNTVNLINCVVQGSDWLFLRKGLNIFSYHESGRLDNLDMEIVYDILYMGV